MPKSYMFGRRFFADHPALIPPAVLAGVLSFAYIGYRIYGMGTHTDVDIRQDILEPPQDSINYEKALEKKKIKQEIEVKFKPEIESLRNDLYSFRSKT